MLIDNLLYGSAQLCGRSARNGDAVVITVNNKKEFSARKPESVSDYFDYPIGIVDNMIPTNQEPREYQSSEYVRVALINIGRK